MTRIIQSRALRLLDNLHFSGHGRRTTGGGGNAILFYLIPLMGSFFLISCGNDTRTPSSSSQTTAESDSLRGKAPSEMSPADASLPSCPEGYSIDPPLAELEPGDGGPAKSIGAQMNQLRHLMSSYPQSSMLRVRAAKLSLGQPPAGNPILSQKLLETALELHKRGCSLSEELEWEARESLGLAHMLQENYAQAVKIFQENAERWPTIPQTRFNLASAQCRLQKIDSCRETFAESLRIADQETPPEFIESGVTAYHFVHQSRQSMDMAALRADPRYEETIEPYLLKNPHSRR